MERASTQHTDPDGDALVGELRRVLAVADPIPEHVQLVARLAIQWRTLDAEFAELVHDSRVDEPQLALRSTATARVLTFEAGDLTIEIETEHVGGAAGDTLRVVGQVIPPGPADITVRNNDELFVASADERGRFDAEGLAPGRLSLRCRLDGRLVETDWLTI